MKLDTFPLIFDGAFGTMLQKKNAVKLGELPAMLNLTNPKIITEIYNEYVDAGSQVVTTNTFEANRLKLGKVSVDEVVNAAIEAAKASKAPYTALDIGPTGKLLEPMGSFKFNEAYEVFKEIIQAAGDRTDLIILETFSDLGEMKAAILAAKENSNLPVIASMTFTDDGRTFTGTDPITAALTMQGLGADAIGVNCSLCPEELLPVVEQILAVAEVPVIVQANAGLPVIRDNQTVYDISPEEYGKSIRKMAQMGVQIFGGCCGTDPEYIREIVKAVKEDYREPSEINKRPAITSSTKTLFLDDGIKVIGERINPTGKQPLKEALRNQTYDIILTESLSQQDQGADILDINVGLPEIDEAKTLEKVILDISGVCRLPLQIDTTKKEALEAALRIYPGIPIINSVNGTEESLKTVLPLAKKYGAYVIGLLLDEQGIPETTEKRLEIAEKIIAQAQKSGIPKEHIIIDALCLTASAQQEAVKVSLETLRRLKEELGVLTTLGVSNVSFGLPERDLFNSVYLTAALNSGLDLPIINPGINEIQDVLHVYRVINGEDKESKDYINYSSARTRKVIEQTKNQTEKALSDDLKGCIIDGLKEKAQNETKRLLEEKEPEDIINEFIIPALTEVGSRFENGSIFLPQLMQSASAVKGAFDLIKAKNNESGKKDTGRGRILLATVKGDIHDIGKNIVKMMLENYGYSVYDLGNDVDAETIVSKAKELKTPLIGLSALMTTTVDSMKEIIQSLRDNGFKDKIMVGGAVLTADYAQMIDADYYGQDAQAAVRIANEYFKN